VQLDPGDMLVLYTDGLTDAENATGDTLGTTRVLDWASCQWRRPAAAVEKDLLHTVSQFCSGHRQTDDLTLLIVRFLGNQS
jgi:serine phosphatase RsbU (regulator of sigma subunit)